MDNLNEAESSSGDGSSSDSDTSVSSSSSATSIDDRAPSSSTPSLLTETVSVIKEQAQIESEEDNKKSADENIDFSDSDEDDKENGEENSNSNSSLSNVDEQSDSNNESVHSSDHRKSEGSSSSNSDVDPAQLSENSDGSQSSEESDSQKTSRKKKKSAFDIKMLVEENPEMYGVRRSGRSRREPQRLNLKEDSDEAPSKKRKSRRNSGAEWQNQDSSEEEESSDDSFPKRHIPIKVSRRRITPSRRRSVGKSSSRMRNLSSDDEDSDEDIRRESTRRTSTKVSYKEQSADETDSEDVIEMDSAFVFDESCEAIERIVAYRIARKGANGCSTTVYAIEGSSDPNENFDPGTEEGESQYFIKWKNWSYIHNTWETEETLKQQKVKGMKKLENYMKQQEAVKAWKEEASPEDLEYHECQMEATDELADQYTHVERIIAHRPRVSDQAHEKPKSASGSLSTYDYYCKWQGLPYSDCTWEDGSLIKSRDKPRIDEYFRRLKSQRIPSKVCKALKVRPKFVEIKEQPKFLGGKDRYELRDYQLHGLNWLVHSWYKEHSVILADEMGLGKTIQTIGFIAYLSNQFQLHGPFLIVVPLSTMAAWIREFHQWAPELNIIVYIGDIHSRNTIREYEWCHSGNKRLKFNVVLTTYEILLKDKGFLGREDWAVLAIDEAHRLKNDDSLLYKTLYTFNTRHRLLITGTPLQNSLKELWALLHFIMPDMFDDWEEFEQDNKDSDVKGYSKLHKKLEPFLLRRVKKDVEKSLPAKVEQILRVEMSSIQKRYYKWILTKNYKSLNKGLKGNASGFLNIVMELKKCCNHATLIRPPEVEAADKLQQLISGSGKLVLLDKLLCRLKDTGHRVLIFSQMVRMLDILSDYLQMRHFQFQRLDGSMKGDLRKQALDRFNAENSPDFCFLLSTRAGGLGINLATADTVIIFDSDWNPQNDLQAQARAHRIGQKNQVNIYRLVTKGSVEENIVERAKQKMVLDHLVIQRMDTTGKTVLSKGSTSSSNANPFNKDELQSILKFGAQDLFKDSENDEQEPIVDIDEILRRAETAEDQPEAIGFELLSQFKVASFGTFDDKEEGKSDTEEVDWTEIIPAADRLKIDEEEKKEMEMEMYLPPRSRRSAHVDAPDDESDWENNSKFRKKKKDEESYSSGDESGEDRPKRRGRPRTVNKDVKGFSDAEIRRFIKSYKKFPCPLKRLESIASDADLMEKALPDLKKVGEMLRLNCIEAMAEHQKNKDEENQDPNNEKSNIKKRDRGPSFKLSGVNVNAKSILSCENELEPLDMCLPLDPKERQTWTLDAKCKDAHWDIPWEVEDDSRLLRGIYEYGMGNWESIKMDPAFDLGGKILPDDDSKPQGKHLQTRCEYLLRVLRKQVDIQTAPFLGKAQKSRKRKAISKATIENDDSDDDSTAGTKKRKTSLKTDKQTSSSCAEIDSTIQSVIDNTASPDSILRYLATNTKKPYEKEKKKKNKDLDKNKSKKTSKKNEKHNGPMHFTANSLPVAVNESSKKKDKKGAVDDTDDIFKTCKKLMRPIKDALLGLNYSAKDVTNPQYLEITKSNFLKTGDYIAKILEGYTDPTDRVEMRGNLWVFATNFTEEKDPKVLYKMYKILTKQRQKESQSYEATPTKPSSSPSKHSQKDSSSSSKKYRDNVHKSRKHKESQDKSRSESHSSHKEKKKHTEDNSHDHRDRDKDRVRSRTSDDKRRDRIDHHNSSYRDRNYTKGMDYKSRDYKESRYNSSYKPDRYNQPYQRSRDVYNKNRNHSDRRERLADMPSSYHNSSSWSSSYSSALHHPMQPFPSSYNSSTYHQASSMPGMPMAPHVMGVPPMPMSNYSNSPLSPNTYPTGVSYSSSHHNSSESWRRDYRKASPGSHSSEHVKPRH